MSPLRNFLTTAQRAVRSYSAPHGHPESEKADRRREGASFLATRAEASKVQTVKPQLILGPQPHHRLVVEVNRLR